MTSQPPFPLSSYLYPFLCSYPNILKSPSILHPTYPTNLSTSNFPSKNPRADRDPCAKMSMNDVNLAPGNNNQPIKSTGAEKEGESVQALGGGKVVEPPSIGSGTGSSGQRREEELRAKVPGLEEKEKMEQGK
ncbi:hypothetical protein G7Y79_00039g076110 [Physcia stellaris]|nr:hypothetical protein G7Y79_00039g076110 [Physcia stellaris]